MNTLETDITLICPNCKMVLTEYNKTGFCTSFCRDTFNGIVPDIRERIVKKVVEVRKELSGTVYVKMKGIEVKRECFTDKVRCRWLIERYNRKYPDFEISVMFDE